MFSSPGRKPWERMIEEELTPGSRPGLECNRASGIQNG